MATTFYKTFSIGEMQNTFKDIFLTTIILAGVSGRVSGQFVI